MLVYLNGESKEIREDLTLAQLVDELGLPALRIAIELNRMVLRRSEWESTRLAPDDRIEIVHFVGGGCLGNRSIGHMTERTYNSC